MRVLADAVEARDWAGTQRKPGHHHHAAEPAGGRRPRRKRKRTRAGAGGRRFIANPTGATGDLGLLRRAFAEWAANDARFLPLAENNALLEEVKPLSKDLSALGAAGLRMLDCLAGGQPAPADWLARQNTDLARMQKPALEVLMAAARPVKLLADELERRAKP